MRETVSSVLIVIGVLVIIFPSLRVVYFERKQDDILGAWESLTYHLEEDAFHEGSEAQDFWGSIKLEDIDGILAVSYTHLLEFNLADNTDWVLHGDGYFYFKYYLTQGQVTSELLQSVTFSDLGPEYSGKTLSVKVLVEGVQTTHDAWKDVYKRQIQMETKSPN